MTDNELIALAAKAAGYDKTMEVRACIDKGGNYPEFIKHTYWDRFGEHNEYWNPLKDDGDALRLAVKLQLFQLDDLMFSYGDIDLKGNPELAVRRAIVRAAAAIGNQDG